MLIRQPSLDEPVQGQATDLQIQADEMLRRRDMLVEMLARHTGQSREQVATDIERDKIFDASAAQEYGLIDGLTRNRKVSAHQPVAR